MKKSKGNKLFIGLGILIIVFLAIVIYSLTKEKEVIANKEIAKKLNLTEFLSIKDYIKVDLDVASNYLIFKDKKDKCMAIVMPITEQQAYSISTGIKNAVEYRPMTHDIIKDIMDNYNISIVLIKITELKNDVYFASIIIKQDGKYLNLDIRPSDASAIAARYKTDIYIRKDLLKNAQNIC